MTQSDQAPTPGSHELLTAEDVRAYLRVNARTVYRLIRSGELPAARVGRQWRVSRSDLDAFLDGHRLTAVK
jgi:excisionase family DNA binding protein